MKLSKMGKTELRAACRDAKVKGYSKLTVGGMRDALVQVTTAKPAQAPKVFADADGNGANARVLVQPQEREERNGVRAPLPGPGVCRRVWDKCEELRKAGTLDWPTLRAWSDKNQLTRSNSSQEMSAFRKYHGIARPTKTA